MDYDSYEARQASSHYFTILQKRPNRSNRTFRRTFQNYLRMTPERFEELVGLVRPYIERMDTKLRKAITVGTPWVNIKLYSYYFMANTVIQLIFFYNVPLQVKDLP